MKNKSKETQKDFFSKLRQCISAGDCTGVKACLKQGADPNEALPIENYHDYQESNFDYSTAPYNHLRFLLFIMCSNFVEQDPTPWLPEICEILLSAGACPVDAYEFYKILYGEYKNITIEKKRNLSERELTIEKISHMVYSSYKKEVSNAK